MNAKSRKNPSQTTVRNEDLRWVHACSCAWRVLRLYSTAKIRGTGGRRSRRGRREPARKGGGPARVVCHFLSQKNIWTARMTPFRWLSAAAFLAKFEAPHALCFAQTNGQPAQLVNLKKIKNLIFAVSAFLTRDRNSFLPSGGKLAHAGLRSRYSRFAAPAQA